MPFWITGLIVTVVSGSLATAYLWLFRRQKDETSAGLQALSGMRWREFLKLVLSTLGQRGLHPADAEHESHQSSSDFILILDGKQWLLSCKHGSAYRIGSVLVDELAANVRLRGATGGILATEGKIEKSGHEAALKHSIEVLDGPRLWQEAKPCLDPVLRDEIVGNASRRAQRHIAIAWLAAILLGAIAMLASSGLNSSPTPPAASVAAAPAAPAPSIATPAREEPVAVYREPTEAELEQQRQAVLKALASTPGIARSIWMTRSTLSVDRTAPEASVWPWICLELERHPALRTSRVQLNPPQGSEEPVRWRQCKTM